MSDCPRSSNGGGYRRRSQADRRGAEFPNLDGREVGRSLRAQHASLDDADDHVVQKPGGNLDIEILANSTSFGGIREQLDEEADLRFDSKVQVVGSGFG